MTSLSSALATEHAQLAAEIEALRRLADDCGEERPGPLVLDVDASIAFLEHVLLPHAEAEDAVLYPAVARLLGAPLATAPMIRDHAEIRHLTAELRRHRGELATAVHPAAVGEVRRLLYALHAVLSLHVAKEEELYLPLLDAELNDEEADALLHRMHEATTRITSRPAPR